MEWTFSWQTIGYALLIALERSLVSYVVLIDGTQLMLLLLGWARLRRRQRIEAGEREALLRSPLCPAVGIIAPAHNEAATVAASTRAMLTLQYPNHEVIVVNDGSKDETLRVLIEEFGLFRSERVPTGGLATKRVKAVYESSAPLRLLVIDKENGGKADALNVGLNYARTPIVAAVDSDSLLESDAIIQSVKPFMDEPDTTVAVGGMVRSVNGCGVEGGQVTHMTAPPRFIALFQSLEYLRAFLGARVGLSFMGSLLIISGAFGLFRRDVVLAAGGFLHSTVGEDMELVVRLHETLRRDGKAYRIPFVADPVCCTEVPESWSVLKRQRNRWQRGAIDSLWLHRRAMFRARFGVIGLFAMPYFLFFEVLAPMAELTGYLLVFVGLAIGRVSVAVGVGFFFVCVLFGMLLSVGAVVLDGLTARRHPSVRDVLRLFAAGIVENLGVRQMVAVWRLKGTYDWFRGNTTWGVMERRGFGPAPAKPAAG